MKVSRKKTIRLFNQYTIDDLCIYKCYSNEIWYTAHRIPYKKKAYLNMQIFFPFFMKINSTFA